MEKMPSSVREAGGDDVDAGEGEDLVRLWVACG